MKDFYYILGTASDCTRDEIDEAYRKLAQKFAPGTFEQDHFLQSHFREITEAYSILSDPERRRKYDHALKRSYVRKGRYFNISYLNIAVTLALLVFTGLFGWYVIRLVKGKEVKAAPQVAQAEPEPVVTRIKHHKKHHYKIKVAGYSRKYTLVDTTALAAAPKPVVAAVKKPAPVAVIKPAAPVLKADSGYAAFLKTDLSGPIYLHRRADYMSDVMSVLPHHAHIRVLEKDRNFYKISYNGQAGYVPRSTIE